MKCSPQGIRAGISPASCRRAGGRGPSPCTPYPLLRSRAEAARAWDRQKPAPRRRETSTAASQAPNRKNQRKPKDYGCIGPSLVEEALACKASLRWHLDSATQAERQAD